MTSEITSDEAREGLFDSVAGKAKELAGALTGKADLIREGQLQQADARARREANTQEAIADAHAERAAEELREGKHRAGEERRAAAADFKDSEQVAVQIAAAERANAESGAHKQERVGRARASADATQDVRETVAEARSIRAEADAVERDVQRERERLVGDADAEERRVAELRAEANNPSKGTRP
jgi:uncharacterized protein YjbJ (UPF0337 family)